MLDIHNVTAELGGRRILDKVSLTVEQRRLGVLFGPNGAGKSTLFRCVLGIVRHGGDIRVDGQSIRGWPAQEVARAIAYVPQDHGLAFSYPVRDVVLMGRNPHRGGVFGPRRADLAAALDALARLGLEGLADRPFATLSGGQRQLVLIARAVAQDARFLLFDEPTASLDFGNQLLVWRVVRGLVDDGRGALVCTHDPNHALWFSDHATVMGREGAVVADGPTRDVIDAGRVRELYACESVFGAVGALPVVVPTGR